MAVRNILRIGDPRLREVSKPVELFDTPELHELIDDMFDTMAAADGAGLAAPQIGELQRIMIFGVQQNPRYPDAEEVPMTVLINPEYSVISDAVLGSWEGCLSVPDMRGYVERQARIKYRGYDQFGMLVEREADGFHAIVFQHEYDHLDGILYPDRLNDRSLFGYTEELAASGII
ncbi:MAG: peptide deformylase [Gammaproteobacteria bacterium]|nr:peptide deformylase [Gammaproteobacteria bacterium]MDH5304872.1 peptide deformylase [Gammaproteobacteria bacterium]MDH5323039.1 peptide deformylase [Gammaproteobacteria bacterium]